VRCFINLSRERLCVKISSISTVDFRDKRALLDATDERCAFFAFYSEFRKLQ